MSNVTGQLTSTPSSPRVVEESSIQDASSPLGEEQPSNKDVLPEGPIQSTDTEPKRDMMDETKVSDDKETDNQQLDQGTSNEEQFTDALQVQAEAGEESAVPVAAAEADAAGVAASAENAASSVVALDDAESRQPTNSDVVDSGLPLDDKDEPLPGAEKATKSDVSPLEDKKLEADQVVQRALERDSEKTLSSASHELEQQHAPQQATDLDENPAQQGEVQSPKAGQIMQSRILSPEKYCVPLATSLPGLPLYGTQNPRQIVEYGLEWPPHAEPVKGSSNQSFKDYLIHLEQHLNKVSNPIYKDVIKDKLDELTEMMEITGFQLNHKLEGHFMKTKVGFLSRLEDNEIKWPHTMDECFQHAMLVLAPCVQTTGTSTSSTRQGAQDSLMAKQGDVVVTGSGDYYIFLGGAKIHSPVGTSIKDHHPSKHHVLSIPSEPPMAYLWQPGEEKGTITIEKTSCQNIRNVTSTAAKSDSKSAQQNEFKKELVRQWRETHYTVLTHLYQCIEVRYSSIIGLEKTEKFCFPAINLDLLPKNFAFDAAQPTPSGANSSSSSEDGKLEKEDEGADEHEDEAEERSEDEVIMLPPSKEKKVNKKGQNDLKAQKGVKAGKEVKEDKEIDGQPSWAVHCSHSSKRAKNMQAKVTELSAKVANAKSAQHLVALRNSFLHLKADFEQMLTIIHPWGSGKNFKGEKCIAGVTPITVMKSMMQELATKLNERPSRPSVQTAPSSSKSTAVPSTDSKSATTLDRVMGEKLEATLQKLTESINKPPPQSSSNRDQAENRRHYEEQVEDLKKNAELKVQALQDELYKKSLEQAKFEAKTEMDALVREREEKLMSVQVEYARLQAKEEVRRESLEESSKQSERDIRMMTFMKDAVQRPEPDHQERGAMSKLVSKKKRRSASDDSSEDSSSSSSSQSPFKHSKKRNKSKKKKRKHSKEPYPEPVMQFMQAVGANSRSEQERVLHIMKTCQDFRQQNFSAPQQFPGYQQASSTPFAYPPQAPQQQMGYQQPPQLGYQQPVPPQLGYQQPPPALGYQQPPPQQLGYQQPLAPQQLGFQQPPPQHLGYQQPPPFGYQQQPPPFGYQQTPQLGYQQPPPPQLGYPQQPPPPQVGYHQQPPPHQLGQQQDPSSSSSHQGYNKSNTSGGF